MELGAPTKLSWTWTHLGSAYEFSHFLFTNFYVAISDLEMAKFEKVLNCKVVALEILFKMD